MASLNIKLANQNIPPGLLDMPDFTDAFVNAMNGQTPAANKVLVINSPPPYQEVINVVDWNKPTKFVVSELPKVVVPTEVTVQTGMSLVAPAQNLPAILNVVANNNNNADSANAGNKTIFNDNGAQAQPAGVAGAAAVPGQPVGQMDKNWDTVFAKLNFTEQDKEFTKVGIPPFRMQKQYIEVQLQRQEVLPDGSFGKIDMVQGLPMNRPPVDRKNAADFIKWSADPEAQRIILAPPFYTIVKGTSWEIPHKDVPAVAQAQQPVEFNLQQKYQEWKTLKTMDEQKKFQAAMTPEQRQQFNTYRLAEEDKEKKAKAPPPNRQQQPPQRYVPPRGSGVGGGRGAAPGRGENFDAIDPSLLREMYADGDPPARRRPLPQEYDNAYLRMRSMRRPYQGDYSPLQPLEGQPQQSILGNLQPDALGNVDIWAHDETAQPGRTYRYRLRAVIKNPVYDTNIGSKPEMNQAPYLPADLTKGALDMTSAWRSFSKW